MNKATVLYYITENSKNPVRDFIQLLEKRQQAKIRRILQLIQEYGVTAPLPHLRKLTGTPLWEIRILGQDNIRVLYSPIQKDSILLLHGFIKKSQKTPPRELETARSRLKNWSNRQLSS